MQLIIFKTLKNWGLFDLEIFTVNNVEHTPMFTEHKPNFE
jgi:hypothetical protein